MKVRIRPEIGLLVGLGLVVGTIGVEVAMGQLREARQEATASRNDSVRDRNPPPQRRPAQPRPATTGTEDALPLGSQAPDFKLADMDGRTRSLSEFRGNTTVLAFFCGCGRCAIMAQLLGNMEELIAGKKPQNVAVASIKPSLLPQWQENTGFKAVFLPEVKKGPVVTQYRGEPCPRVYVIDPDLRIRHVTPTPREDRPASDILNPLARALGSAWVNGQSPGAPPRG